MESNEELLRATEYVTGVNWYGDRRHYLIPETVNQNGRGRSICGLVLLTQKEYVRHTTISGLTPKHVNDLRLCAHCDRISGRGIYTSEDQLKALPLGSVLTDKVGDVWMVDTHDAHNAGVTWLLSPETIGMNSEVVLHKYGPLKLQWFPAKKDTK